MKVYDLDTECIKCGNKATFDKFNPCPAIGEVEEIIQRECSRCGYSWEELPLDHPQNILEEDLNDPFLTEVRSLSKELEGWIPTK